MITLRHHIVSLVAVFLALAVGIVLGGGPLSELGRTASSNHDTTAAPESATVAEAFPDTFAGAVAAPLLAGKLADREVAVVTLPGADETQVTGMADLIKAAGGSLSARYTLTATMMNPSQKTLVDTLGSQLLTQQPKKQIPIDAPTYERAGHLLGVAIATTDLAGAPTSGKSRSVAEAFVGADLLDKTQVASARAPLVLVVLGDEPPPEGGDTILSGLVAGLDAQSVGTVVVGTSKDASDGGQLAILRGTPAGSAITTVDSIDTSAGRVTAALAVARATGTKTGSFGAFGSDGPVPTN